MSTRKRRSRLVRELDAGLWVIRDAAPNGCCCYDSREAALRALDLSVEERQRLQSAAVGRNGDTAAATAGVITYRDVLDALSRSTASAPT
jgi:hypothetical protein